MFYFDSSRTVYTASGGIECHIQCMKDWIDTVTSSISHATFYLHCLHKSARSYVTCFASSHEGTNFGLKNHSIPMKANASLTTTAKVLAMQANLKTADLDQSAYRNMVKKVKKWSDLPTSTTL